MTYAHGSIPTAADYNSFAGLTGTAAADAATATEKGGYLWGIGWGDRGYGQSSPALTARSSGQVDKAWSDLRTVLAGLAAWQNTSTTKLPSTAQMGAGYPHTAFPAGETLSIPDLLDLLDANRLNYQIGNMSLTDGTTSTRSSSWSASASCTLRASWASESAARHFFNTGGEIRYTLGHTSTATAQDSDWKNIIDGLCIAIRAHSAVRVSGPSTGTLNSVGFYELTTSYQPIITGTNVGGGAYSANDFLIEARSTVITGTNGGNGSDVQIRVTLTDQHSGPADSVSAGTTANMSHLKAAAGLSSLPAAPSYNTPNAFG